jgi:hypothetical protein
VTERLKILKSGILRGRRIEREMIDNRRAPICLLDPTYRAYFTSQIIYPRTCNGTRGLESIGGTKSRIRAYLTPAVLLIYRNRKQLIIGRLKAAGIRASNYSRNTLAHIFRRLLNTLACQTHL